MGLPWRASSRGLALERAVNIFGPMAVSAVKALEALGVRAAEAVTRLPAQATRDDLERAALIVALKHAEHLPLLQERFEQHPFQGMVAAHERPRRNPCTSSRKGQRPGTLARKGSLRICWPRHGPAAPNT
jgi:hypothetical protein